MSFSIWAAMMKWFPEEEIRQAISNERVESRIYVEGSRVYLSYERMCEVKSAKRIVSMILQEGFTKIDDLDSKIDNAERTLHQRLAPSQRNAVKLCLSHPISIMTGGPGSGKTTTLRFILDIYKAAFPANEVPAGCTYWPCQSAHGRTDRNARIYTSLGAWPCDG